MTQAQPDVEPDDQATTLGLSDEFRGARFLYDQAAAAWETALEAEIVRLTQVAFPAADRLHVTGDYGENGLRLQAEKVTAAGVVLDGEVIAGFLSESWEPYNDAVDGLLLELGELSPEAWVGDAEIELGDGQWQVHRD